MKILAINTSGNLAEVCIRDEKNVFSCKVESPYSENIMSAIQKTLEESNFNVGDIDAFGVVTGPGSFTGIRIGMAVVKGLLCGLDKKCVSINSFELVSYNIKDEDFIVVIDSGNADFYYAIFKNRVTTEMGFGTIDKICEYAKKTNLKIYYPNNEREKFEMYDGFNGVDISKDTLANLVFEKNEKGQTSSMDKLSPVYIKFSQAEIGLSKQMAENLSFRDAEIGDENALSIVDKQCFSGGEVYSEKSFLEELSEPSKHYSVALYQNLIIGYVGVQMLGDELNLLKLAVLPQYQKLGVGFKLMEKSFDFKKDKNLSNYFLEVSENNQKAIKLYQKFGFKTKSVREKYYSDGSNALVMFSK